MLALRRRVRALRRERRARPRRPRPCGRSCRSPSGWAGCTSRSPAARADDPRDRVRGPDRRLRHPHPHAVGAEGRAGRGRRGAGGFVNAPQLAAGARRRGARVASTTARDYVNLITSARAGSTIATPRRGHDLRQAATHRVIVGIDDHTRRRPAGGPHARGPQRRHTGDDRQVATAVGDAGINIDDMDVGTNARVRRRSWCWPPTGPSRRGRRRAPRHPRRPRSQSHRPRLTLDRRAYLSVVLGQVPASRSERREDDAQIRTSSVGRVRSTVPVAWSPRSLAARRVTST